MSGEQITQAKLLIWAKTTQQILQVQTKSGFWHTVKTCLQFALARETRKHLALPKTPRTWSNPRKNGMTFTSTSRSYRIIRNIVSTCINIYKYNILYIYDMCKHKSSEAMPSYAKLHTNPRLCHTFCYRESTQAEFKDFIAASVPWEQAWLYKHGYKMHPFWPRVLVIYIILYYIILYYIIL